MKQAVLGTRKFKRFWAAALWIIAVIAEKNTMMKMLLRNSTTLLHVLVIGELRSLG